MTVTCSCGSARHITKISYSTSPHTQQAAHVHEANDTVRCAAVCGLHCMLMCRRQSQHQSATAFNCMNSRAFCNMHIYAITVACLGISWTSQRHQVIALASSCNMSCHECCVGKPSFGTLIALLHNGVPVLGIINQPITRERWVGVAGQPSTFNGEPGGLTRPVQKLHDADACKCLLVSSAIRLCGLLAWSLP